MGEWACPHGSECGKILSALKCGALAKVPYQSLNKPLEAVTDWPAHWAYRWEEKMARIQLRRFWKSASVSLLRAEEGSSQPDLVSPEACHLLCNDGKLLDSPGALLSTISVLERRALGARRAGNTMSFLSAPGEPRCWVVPWSQLLYSL